MLERLRDVLCSSFSLTSTSSLKSSSLISCYSFLSFVVFRGGRTWLSHTCSLAKNAAHVSDASPLHTLLLRACYIWQHKFTESETEFHRCRVGPSLIDWIMYFYWLEYGFVFFVGFGFFWVFFWFWAEILFSAFHHFYCRVFGYLLSD